MMAIVTITMLLLLLMMMMIVICIEILMDREITRGLYVVNPKDTLFINFSLFLNLISVKNLQSNLNQHIICVIFSHSFITLIVNHA